ncbi:putative uncharacterized protein DDB_G0267840 isoform X2 [Aethina tumida]|uniref:putative uncharacterized protein DDB_G0267840 isoform X2 n=1 Tax=Aethina tumida TaxID=116153 RepID=UPI0021498E10|nr:putative uncharacterized protein DDB_G0267840 isoform X2 [Aethina tumida]
MGSQEMKMLLNDKVLDHWNEVPDTPSESQGTPTEGVTDDEKWVSAMESHLDNEEPDQSETDVTQLSSESQETLSKLEIEQKDKDGPESGSLIDIQKEKQFESNFVDIPIVKYYFDENTPIQTNSANEPRETPNKPSIENDETISELKLEYNDTEPNEPLAENLLNNLSAVNSINKLEETSKFAGEDKGATEVTQLLTEPKKIPSEKVQQGDKCVTKFETQYQKKKSKQKRNVINDAKVDVQKTQLDFVSKMDSYINKKQQNHSKPNVSLPPIQSRGTLVEPNAKTDMKVRFNKFKPDTFERNIANKSANANKNNEHYSGNKQRYDKKKSNQYKSKVSQSNNNNNNNQIPSKISPKPNNNYNSRMKSHRKKRSKSDVAYPPNEPVKNLPEIQTEPNKAGKSRFEKKKFNQGKPKVTPVVKTQEIPSELAVEIDKWVSGMKLPNDNKNTKQYEFEFPYPINDSQGIPPELASQIDKWVSGIKIPVEKKKLNPPVTFPPIGCRATSCVATTTETDKRVTNVKWYNDTNKVTPPQFGFIYPPNASHVFPQQFPPNTGKWIPGMEWQFQHREPRQMFYNFPQPPVAPGWVVGMETPFNHNAQYVYNHNMAQFHNGFPRGPPQPQSVPNYLVPEYILSDPVRLRLPMMDLGRYQDDLLFYLFYLDVDNLQIEVAEELYNRGWRCHMEEKVWITAIPGMVPFDKTFIYERGMYYFFDVEDWRIVAKVFHLDYSKMGGWPRDN